MGHKQSKVARQQSPPPPYSAKEDSKGGRSNEKTFKTEDKPKNVPEEVKKCRFCGRHFYESQLNNRWVKTTCGRYHSSSTTTRRKLLTKQGQPPISAAKSTVETANYFDNKVWLCCLQAAHAHPDGGWSSANGCKRYDGKHEA
ncbi:hypothetical protein QBC37DRAFT_405723 [Rhypophila decipiens]|uniref:Uncharacterized protein n=1 Tax=Rhypophila decipiens TaxID=261697 RepID=A0AAN6XWK0_9PEZI|nr:hypothetical protein QBC37DRAFT_405723 [Rhypophila decipiens]